MTPLTDELHDKLDDLVDAWHESPGAGPPLLDWLKMTEEQYTAFVENRDLPGTYVPPAFDPPPKWTADRRRERDDRGVGLTPSQYAERLRNEHRGPNGGMFIVLALIAIGVIVWLFRLLLTFQP